MQTYSERATAVAWESQIAVQVLLSRDNDDLEMVLVAGTVEYLSREEFAARNLRCVGLVGLRGLKPMCAFKEPLPPPVVDAISVAFIEYVRVLLGENFAEHMAAAEVAELERLFGLVDPRMN